MVKLGEMDLGFAPVKSDIERLSVPLVGIAVLMKVILAGANGLIEFVHLPGPMAANRQERVQRSQFLAGDSNLAFSNCSSIPAQGLRRIEPRTNIRFLDVRIVPLKLDVAVIIKFDRFRWSVWVVQSRDSTLPEGGEGYDQGVKEKIGQDAPWSSADVRCNQGESLWTNIFSAVCCMIGSVGCSHMTWNGSVVDTMEQSPRELT